jgi:hypothetical protein
MTFRITGGGKSIAYNKTAWMSMEIWEPWLLDFNKRMKEQKRNVILLVDNAGGHNNSCINKLSHECESENKYCTKNKTHCNEYKRFYGYLKISINLIQIDPSFNDRFKKEKKKLQSFNKMIHACERKIYKFNSNDFCLNGENCIEIRKVIKGFGFNYRSHKVSKQIDCK